MFTNTVRQTAWASSARTRPLRQRWRLPKPVGVVSRCYVRFWGRRAFVSRPYAFWAGGTCEGLVPPLCLTIAQCPVIQGHLTQVGRAAMQ
eukprot:scaffold3418_cov124-Isochrysis_galbana.AAC.6